MRWQSKMWQRAHRKASLPPKELLNFAWNCKWVSSKLKVFSTSIVGRDKCVLKFVFIFVPFLSSHHNGSKGLGWHECCLQFEELMFLWTCFFEAVLKTFWFFCHGETTERLFDTNLLLNCGYWAFKLLFVQKVYTVYNSWIIFEKVQPYCVI